MGMIKRWKLLKYLVASYWVAKRERKKERNNDCKVRTVSGGEIRTGCWQCCYMELWYLKKKLDLLNNSYEEKWLVKLVYFFYVFTVSFDSELSSSSLYISLLIKCIFLLASKYNENADDMSCCTSNLYLL